MRRKCTELLDKLADFPSPFYRDVLIGPFQTIQLVACLVREYRGIFGVGESGVRIHVCHEVLDVVLKILDDCRIRVEEHCLGW